MDCIELTIKLSCIFSASWAQVSGELLPKIFKILKRGALKTPHAAVSSMYSPLIPILPEDEEHVSVARINKWVSLADAALATFVPSRKRA